MPALTCQIHTLYDTQRLADGVAVWLAACGHSYQTLCLSGDLGAGKSEFCRQLIQSYYQDMTLEVPSPTFTLVQTYSPNEQSGGCAECWHMDLYRLQDPEEVFALGVEDAFIEAACLVEWPEIMGDFWPKRAIMIAIERAEDESRSLHIEAPDAFIEKLENQIRNKAPHLLQAIVK